MRVNALLKTIGICSLAMCITHNMNAATPPNNENVNLKRAVTGNVYASNWEKKSKAELNEAKAKQIEEQMLRERQIAQFEYVEAVRRSLAAPYPSGKDCSGGMCAPYVAVLKEVLWGFTMDEPITVESIKEYKEVSDRATRNMKAEHAQFDRRLPVVPNLIIGLPVPFVFHASLYKLAADERPYWFWHYTTEPNLGKPKYGKVTWECRDMQNNAVVTRSNFFKDDEKFYMSCNDIASKFAEAENSLQTHR